MGAIKSDTRMPMHFIYESPFARFDEVKVVPAAVDAPDSDCCLCILLHRACSIFGVVRLYLGIVMRLK